MLAHDFQDAAYVRQSLDYAQFGRVTAKLGANGLADSTGVVTAYAHHGSLLDAATGLQQKGERWYSPDLGRFVSEDPIQDGSNWYMFAGNDPVNYADPSGLSQQGHPFASTPFGGFVDADRGRQILGHSPISIPHSTPATTVRSVPQPLSIHDFTYGKDLGALALGNASFPGSLPSVAPRFEGVVEGMRAQAFRDRLADRRRDDGQNVMEQVHALNEARRIAYVNEQFAQRDQGFTGGPNGGATVRALQGFANIFLKEAPQVYNNSRAADQSILRSIYNAVGTTAATLTGIRGLSDAFSRHDAVDGHLQSTQERIFDGVTGTVQLGLTVATAGGWLRPQGGVTRNAGAPRPQAPSSNNSLPKIADDGIDLTTYVPSTGSTRLRPGSVTGNPANQLMETGTPLKNGQGWVSRWTRATADDVAAQNRAIFERYQQVERQSRGLPPDQQHTFRFEQMQQFRTQYREQFLKNRGK